jgi:hypothetical protein
VPSKSTGHHKTGTEPEEVKEEPMAMARAHEQQRRTFFLVPYCSAVSRVSDKDMSHRKSQPNTIVLFLFFTQQKEKNLTNQLKTVTSRADVSTRSNRRAAPSNRRRRLQSTRRGQPRQRQTAAGSRESRRRRQHLAASGRQNRGGEQRPRGGGGVTTRQWRRHHKTAATSPQRSEERTTGDERKSAATKCNL